jgi:hypothetical protein
VSVQADIDPDPFATLFYASDDFFLILRWKSFSFSFQSNSEHRTKCLWQGTPPAALQGRRMSLQGHAVSQAGSMLPETPAKPQTVRVYGKEA